jgi:hypothetical protein
MHQARVVAREPARSSDQRHRLEQRGVAGEHAARARRGVGDLLAERGLARRAEQRDRRPVLAVQRRRERRVVGGGPALGGAVLGARREGPEGACGKAGPGERGLHGRVVEPQARPGAAVEVGAGERAVERDHRRPRLPRLARRRLSSSQRPSP